MVFGVMFDMKSSDNWSFFEHTQTSTVPYCYQCGSNAALLPKDFRFVIWPVRGRPESVDYIRDKRGYKRAPLFHCLKFRYTSAPFYFRTIAQLRGKREEKKKKLLQTVNKIPRTNRQSGFKCTMGRRPLTFLTNNSSVLPFQGFCYRKKNDV